MNKLKTLSFSLLLLFSLALAPAAQAQDWSRLLKGGVELIQSFNVSDDQVKSYVSQFISQSDSQNNVAPDNGEYSQRLARIVNGITQVDGQPLNFKVYVTSDVNAFACADGSVRVYSGLMDLMTDDEVLGVIGHEIGHVAHHDTREAMKTALRTSALRNAVSSAGGIVQTLTDSQLGTLGEAYLNSKYSRKQESNADSYGYDFLKKHGRNPLVLCLAFEKMQALESNSSTSSKIAKLFSSHPDTSTRIKDLEAKAKKEGYTYPTSSDYGVPAKLRTANTPTAGGTSAASNLTSTSNSSTKATTTKSSRTKSRKASKRNSK